MSLATSLYDALTGINIPKDQARDVVEALEHKMTAESATKSDITLVRADIDFLRKDLTAADDSVRKDLSAAIESLRKDLTAAIESLRKDMTAANDSLRKDLMAEIAALRAEMKALEDRLFKKLAALMVTLMGLMFAALTWVGG